MFIGNFRIRSSDRFWESNFATGYSSMCRLSHTLLIPLQQRSELET